MNRGDILPGATYYVGAGCGVPHGFRPIRFRVTKVDDRPGWEGMAWLSGYELATDDTPVENRTIYVITDGLVLCAGKPGPVPPPRRRPTNAGPARIPRPRTSPETTPGRTR